MYNVVSVLYHALQGGETCTQYLQDAQETGDQKLVQFFQEVQECHRHLATRAKEVLAQCLEHANGRTTSHAPSHGHQGAMVSRAQGRAETQGHGREHQEQRR